jgi:hypothetical protein
MKSSLTLRVIRNTQMAKILTPLYFSEVTSNQAYAALRIAILLLNSANQDVQELGYRILLKYTARTRDFVPLYDIAAALGFIPIYRT